LNLRFCVAIALSLCAGCARPRASVALYPTSQSQAEALAGTRAAAKLESRYGGTPREHAAEVRMAWLGAALARAGGGNAEKFTYRLLASHRPNAFSLPPGRIYITRGLYERLADDDLLSAVLAHEMAHIEARDSVKPCVRNLRDALNREASADRRGAEILERAGIAPRVMHRLVELISPELPEAWADARLARLDAAVAKPASER